MPLVAPRAPRRAAHLVAGAQLAAADLGGRDVDVAARLPARVDAHEAAAVGEHVEHARGDLLVGDLVLHDLGLLLGGRRAPRSAPAATARGPLERLLLGHLVWLVLGRRPRTSPLRCPPRSPPRSSEVPSDVSSASSSAVGRLRASSGSSPAGSSAAPPAPRMAPIRSSLRIARYPSTPSSDAIWWRSASGLSASSFLFSTDIAAPNPSERGLAPSPRRSGPRARAATRRTRAGSSSRRRTSRYRPP